MSTNFWRFVIRRQGGMRYNRDITFIQELLTILNLETYYLSVIASQI